MLSVPQRWHLRKGCAILKQTGRLAYVESTRRAYRTFSPLFF